MGSLNNHSKKNNEGEQQYQEQDLSKILYPGRKLYHRGNYLNDKDNSFGEVTVKSFDGYNIIVKTNNGEKHFTVDAIDKNLFLDKSSISKELILDGGNDIAEEELKKYKTEGDIYITEKFFFDKVKSKLEQRYESILNQIKDLRRYGFNNFSYDRDINIHSKYSFYETEKNIVFEMINKPYFGRLNFSKYNVKTIYIGDYPMSDIDKSIYDWREPICQVYYQQNSIMYNKYGLELIRKFDIYKGSFCGYYDSYIKNQWTEINNNDNEIIDDFLLNIMRNQRKSNVIHDIIQTIQKKQYEIISEEVDKNLIIQGCAGSGKTMILMHRLSYIIYNNRDLERKSVKIITPNKNLNFELTDVAKKLQLDDIERYTLNEYYSYLIQRYFQRTNIQPIDNLYVYEDVNDLITDDKLTSMQLSSLYRIDFIQDFSKFDANSSELKELCDLANRFLSKEEAITCNSRAVFLKSFNNRLGLLNSFLKEIKRILKKEKNFNLELELNKRATDLKQIDKQFRDNLDVGLGRLKIAKIEINRIEDFLVISSLLKKFNEIRNVNNSHELYYIMENLVLSKEEKNYIKDNNFLDMKPVIIETDKDRHGNEIQAEVFPIDYYKQQIRDKWGNFNQLEELVNNIRIYMQFIRKDYDSFTNNKNINNFIEEFNELTNIINLLRDYQNKTNNNYFNYIWKSYIVRVKNQNNISLNKKYEFELYALLNSLFSKFGAIENGDKYLFIDEGQDFLERELLTLKSANNNLVINIFGDYYQRIRNVSKKYFFETAKDYDFEKYELDVNYRNCKQITQYINEKCNKKMKSVGLDGSVQQIKFSDLTPSVFKNVIGRKPLIVKDQEAFKKLKKKLKGVNLSSVNIIFTDETRFSPTELNVLDIKRSKGLEFPEVIVFDYKLSNNELYIACSRALEKLIIIGG